MKLYHGSTVPVMAPNVNFAQVGRDFGAAFYTTDIYEQAENTAIRNPDSQNAVFSANFPR